MRRFVAFATLVLSVGLARAQAPPPAATQGPPEFRTGTAVVLLDVVARDKKGRPVRDLRPQDLQVFENGQRCEIRSFRLVESEGTLEPAGAGAVAAPSVPVEPPVARGEGRRAPLNLVTLVFDRMSIEDSRVAEKAARDFVERGLDARTQAAVFQIGTRLGLVQAFTGEKDPLLAAIALATSGRDLPGVSLTAQAQQASRDAVMASGLPVGGQLPEVGDATQPTGERITSPQSRQPNVPADDRGGERKMREWTAAALRMADSLQRQMEGQWSSIPSSPW